MKSDKTARNQPGSPESLGTPVQIAGNICGVCKCGIILSREGKVCAHCGTAVHSACDPRPNCENCGHPYQGYELPKFDPREDAVVPRELRQANSAGAIFAGILLMLVAFLVFMWFQSIMNGR